jgi:predicted nucleic acid-binding Zn ribbon protein
MAIYEYEILGPDGAPTGILEVEQKMSDPALERHPETGAPLRRILSATFAHGAADGGAGFDDCATGTCGIPTGGCAGGSCGI